MPIEVVFLSIAGMATFLLMIFIIGKAETDKARAKGSSSDEMAGMKQLLEDNSAEISRLRARVEVLERLATDEDRKLSGEIDRLRAQPRA